MLNPHTYPVPAPAVPGASAASVSGLSLAEAERLLDWLENQGYTALRAIPEGTTTTVHFDRPQGKPGFGGGSFKADSIRSGR